MIAELTVLATGRAASLERKDLERRPHTSTGSLVSAVCVLQGCAPWHREGGTQRRWGVGLGSTACSACQALGSAGSEGAPVLNLHRKEEEEFLVAFGIGVS